MKKHLDISRIELSIVVPVFNGADSVPSLINEITNLDLEGNFEVILVNDGSKDESKETCIQLVEEASIPITLIDLTKNFGENNAILAGMRQALGDYVITMADDLQHSPKDIPKLLSLARDNNYDVVYSSFKKRRYPWHRNLGSWFANVTATIVLGKPSELYLSPFRCLNQTVVQEITKYSGPYPYIDGLIFQVTSKFGVVKVQHHPRAKNRSNYTFKKLIALWLNIFFNFSTIPMRFCLILGIVCEIFAVVGIGYVLFDVLAYGRTAPGWASLMISSLFLGGAQFIFLGFVGEYVSRTHILLGGKPPFVIREIRTGQKREAYLKDSDSLKR